MSEGPDDDAVSAQPARVRLPMFPLNTVLFPGLTVPLRVFEDRYVALVRHLQAIPDPAMRVFGSVAIREGYEVGTHGNQSLHRVGCRVQLSEVEAHDDGTYDVIAVCRDRIRLDALEVGETFPTGMVTLIDEQGDGAGPAGELDEEIADHTGALFAAYHQVVAQLGGQVVAGGMPSDPVYRSWAMSAVAPLPLPDRQLLLETDDVTERFTLLGEFFAEELRAINVIPSLPATQLNRTGWSPN